MQSMTNQGGLELYNYSQKSYRYHEAPGGKASNKEIPNFLEERK